MVQVMPSGANVTCNSSRLTPISREPKPFCAGSRTGGPPRSCQQKCNRAPAEVSFTVQSMLTQPVAFESAPYLMALVASSWTAMVMTSAWLAGSCTCGPMMTMRSFWNGSRARRTRSRSGARSQFSCVRTSCALLSAWRRATNNSRSAVVALCRVCEAMACIVASVFLTRC